MTAVRSSHRGEDSAERDDRARGQQGRYAPERDDDQKGDGKEGRSGQKRQSGSRASLVKNKHIIEEAINVGVPHQVAYDQWTQYNDWSKIFKKESAERKEDPGGRNEEGHDKSNDGPDDNGDEADHEGNEVNVTAKIGPSQRQWQTEIVAQEPGRRIEWEAKGGVKARGIVTFHRLSDRLTYLQGVIH
jgi:hypothetical protein